MRVLVTRPKEDAERMAAPLRALGATVINEPMLVIMPVAGPTVDLDGVQAVLLTSANGARALAVAVDRRDVPVYAVGDQTARVARDQGFGTVHSAGGDVEALAALVAESLPPGDGALVHAAGSTRAGDLAGALAERGFAVTVARLYDARPTATLSRDLSAALKAGAIDAALFFSPRTAKIFVEHVRKAGLADSLGGLSAYALSPAVAKALSGLTLARVRVADQPTQDALLRVFEADVGDGLLAVETPSPPPAPGPADVPEIPFAGTAPESQSPESQSPDSQVLENPIDEDPPDQDPPDQDRPDQDRPRQGRPHEDRTHEDGEAAYGGSAGADAVDDRGTGAHEDEQTERRTLRTLTAWVVVILLVFAAAIGTLPWWKPLLPPAYQALLPAYPNAPEPATVTDLRAQLDAVTEDLGALRERLDQAQARIGATATTDAVDALAARLDTLEGRAPLTPDGTPTGEAPGTADVDTTISHALSPLAERVSALTATAATLRADLAAVATRVETLSGTMPRTDPRAVALLIHVGLLRERVKDGLPYDDALAPVATGPTLGANHAQALTVLGAHAEGGVPTLEALRRRFEPMSVEVARNAFVPEGQAWWKSTLASIMSSVTVRRTDGVATDGTMGTLSQAAARIADNDLAGAVGALESLEGAAAGAAAEWMTDARAHLAVDAALASLTSGALAGLGATQTTE